MLESELDAFSLSTVTVGSSTSESTRSMTTRRFPNPNGSNSAGSTWANGAITPNGAYIDCIASRYPAVAAASFSVTHSTSW